jgi:GDP-L-fucose synthase
MVCELLDHNIEVIWDDTVGNGQFRKPSDNSKFVELGWKNENYTDFKEAMRETCDWFLENYPKVRGVK